MKKSELQQIIREDIEAIVKKFVEYKNKGGE